MEKLTKNIGVTNFCVCPNCGYRVERSLAVPCFAMRCPKCGTRMQTLA